MDKTRYETRRAITKVARACRARDRAAEQEARRELAEAKVRDAARRVVDTLPPLTPEQIDSVVAILRGVDTSPEVDA